MKIRGLVLAGLVSGAVANVQAACTVGATTPASFGSISSSLARTAPQFTSTGNAGLVCTGALMTLLRSTDSVNVTVTSSAGGLVGPAGDVLRYDIYANNNAADRIDRGTPFNLAQNSILDQWGGLGNTNNQTLPLYLRSIVGANVAAGVYSETLSLFWEWDYCAVPDGQSGCSVRDIGSATSTLTVNMTVNNDCTIMAPLISFGSAPVVSGFSAVNQSLSVSCTKDSAYSVGLDAGQHASGGRRRMASNGHYIAYDIFKGVSGTRWGHISSARRASHDADVNPGVGLGQTSQVFNYSAKVYADQVTPPAGSYSDSVIVDIGF